MDIYINIRSSYYYPQYVNATIYRALLLLAIQFESNRRVFFFFRLLLNIVYTHLECIWCKIWFLYCVYRLLYPSFVRRPAHTKDDVFNELFDARLQPRRFVVRAQESIIIWEKKKEERSRISPWRKLGTFVLYVCTCVSSTHVDADASVVVIIINTQQHQTTTTT